MKLLALPETEETKEEDKKLSAEKDALRERSIAARRELRYLNPEARQKLLGAYGKIEEETE